MALIRISKTFPVAVLLLSLYLLSTIQFPYSCMAMEFSEIVSSREKGDRTLVLDYLRTKISNAAVADLAADPVMFHTVKIDYTDRESAARSNAFLRYIIEPTQYLARESVREIHLTGCSGGDWSLVSNIFDEVKHLEAVKWDSEKTIPSRVLQALEIKNPSAKLHYNLHWGHGRQRPDEKSDAESSWLPWHTSSSHLPESVIGSNSLYSLETHIQYGGSPDPKSMDVVFRILASCPGLRRLHLSISHGGCVVSGGQPYAFDFTSYPTAKLPPLEELSLDGYHLDSKPNGGDWMEWEAASPERHILQFPWSRLPNAVVDWVGFSRIASLGGVESHFFKRDHSELKPGTMTNLHAWLGLMDWSNITSLKLRYLDPSSLRLLQPAVPKLTRLYFKGGDADLKGYLEFLNNTAKPLLDISFKDVWFCDLDNLANIIAIRHGSSIKHLRLTYGGRLDLTRSFMDRLRIDCPNIETLDIDVRRTSSYPKSSNSISSDTASSPFENQIGKREPGADGSLQPRVIGKSATVHDSQSNLKPNSLEKTPNTPVTTTAALAESTSTIALTEPLQLIQPLGPNATAEFDFSVLNRLAQYPNLIHLTLRFKLYSPVVQYRTQDFRGRPADPLIVDKQLAEKVFRYLRARKEGKALETLTIYVGRWSYRHWFGGASPPDGTLMKARCWMELMDGKDEEFCYTKRVDMGYY